jgi:8-oxo-dGTP pyrophosphatase MutT (NUDIX family)
VTESTRKAQVAALPYRKHGRGVDVLLITSRETKRWVIPKGWPMIGLEDHDAAAQEAFEEAGIRGHTNLKSIGTYVYQKRKKSGVTVEVEVTVYPMEVTKILRNWPEKSERRRKWFPSKHAATLVNEEGLQAVIEATLA